MTFRVSGMNLGIPFKETVGDGLNRGHSNSFFAENQHDDSFWRLNAGVRLKPLAVKVCTLDLHCREPEFASPSAARICQFASAKGS